MNRVMIFIDYLNFNGGINSYYYKNYNKFRKNYSAQNIDFTSFSQKLVAEYLPENSYLAKTFLFAPKPDSYLMKNEKYKDAYYEIRKINTNNYFAVIEGRNVAKPKNGDYGTIDVNNSDTFYSEEKGTDVNITVNMLSKAFLHSYDTAVLVSTDTDYFPVLEILQVIGKTVVVAGVVGQKTNNFKEYSDQRINLNNNFFQSIIIDDKETCNGKNNNGNSYD